MKAAVWPFIQNKKFFSVNENCASFKKKEGLKNRVMEEFQDCLNPKIRERRDKETLKDLKKKADALLNG
jgi:hypothetical protein